MDALTTATARTNEVLAHTIANNRRARLLAAQERCKSLKRGLESMRHEVHACCDSIATIMSSSVARAQVKIAVAQLGWDRAAKATAAAEAKAKAEAAAKAKANAKAEAAAKATAGVTAEAAAVEAHDRQRSGGAPVGPSPAVVSAACSVPARKSTPQCDGTGDVRSGPVRDGLAPRHPAAATAASAAPPVAKGHGQAAVVAASSPALHQSTGKAPLSAATPPMDAEGAAKLLVKPRSHDQDGQRVGGAATRDVKALPRQPATSQGASTAITGDVVSNTRSEHQAGQESAGVADPPPKQGTGEAGSHRLSDRARMANQVHPTVPHAAPSLPPQRTVTTQDAATPLVGDPNRPRDRSPTKDVSPRQPATASLVRPGQHGPRNDARAEATEPSLPAGSPLAKLAQPHKPPSPPPAKPSQHRPSATKHRGQDMQRTAAADGPLSSAPVAAAASDPAPASDAGALPAVHAATPLPAASGSTQVSTDSAPAVDHSTKDQQPVADETGRRADDRIASQQSTAREVEHGDQASGAAAHPDDTQHARARSSDAGVAPEAERHGRTAFNDLPPVQVLAKQRVRRCCGVLLRCGIAHRAPSPGHVRCTTRCCRVRRCHHIIWGWTRGWGWQRGWYPFPQPSRRSVGLPGRTAAACRPRQRGTHTPPRAVVQSAQRLHVGVLLAACRAKVEARWPL